MKEAVPVYTNHGEEAKKGERMIGTMSNQQFQNDPAMQEYFNTLPVFVQETIKQSGATLNNVQEMKEVAAKLLHESAQG